MWNRSVLVTAGSQMAMAAAPAAAQPVMEVAAGPSLLDSDEQRGGGSLAVGLRAVHDYDSSSLCTEGGLEVILLMIASAGFACIPGDVWIGNERGADIRFLGAWPDLAAVAFSPSLRVGSHRHARFPSIVGLFLPEIGVGHLRGGGPQVTVRYLRIPFTFWPGRNDRIGVELEPSVLIVAPGRVNALGEREPVLALLLRLEMIARTGHATPI